MLKPLIRNRANLFEFWEEVMHISAIRRMLGTTAAILFIAGCSSGTSSVAPGSHANSPTQSKIHIPAGYRAFPGPAVAGPLIVPIAHANRHGYFSAAASNKILYVADAASNVVNLYDPSVPNPSPIGSISSGLDVPIGVAIDSSGTIYVVNIANNTVTEYLHGSITPSFTITSGMSSPYGIGVDSHGNVFVTNLGTNTVTGYNPGQTSPFETVSGVGPNPVGLAVDESDNVFVADDSDNTIYEIPAGTSIAQNSGLTQLTGPIGLAFCGGTLFVSNFGANTVGVYPKGSMTPSALITDGINEPTLNGIAKPGTFFQSEQTGPVEGYLHGHVHPFSEISGLIQPLGIAAYPKPKG
jgi:hypothetical protein